MAKRRPGRPKKSEDEKTSHRLTVGLTRDEFDKLNRWAEAFRVSKSELIRRAIHRSRLTAPITLETAKVLMELGRMGQNLNQCVRALHRVHARLDLAEDLGKRAEMSEEVMRHVTACEAQVSEIRQMMDTTHRILMDTWDGVRDIEQGERA